MLTRRTRILADRRKGRIVRAPGWQKPVRGTQLNRTHPLARGLFSSIICNEGSGGFAWDHVAQEPALFGSNLSWRGGGVYVTDNNQPTSVRTDYLYLPESLKAPGLDDLTLFVHFFPYSVTYMAFYGAEDYRDYGHFTSVAADFFKADNDHYTTTFEDFVVNTEYTFSVRRDGTTYHAHRNGVQVFTRTVTSNLFYPDTIIGLDTGDNSYAFEGILYAAYLYERALSDVEIAWLHREPYAMFQRERRVSILTPLYRFWPDDAISLWYSKGNYDTLPTGEEDYEDDFQGKDYENVEFADGVYVLQTADGEKAGFRFNKQNTNNTDPISISIENIKSTLAPSSSAVYLQIYNRNTPAWETLDSESVVGADTLFDLSGVQSSDLSYYYDSDNVVRFRVYQAPV